MAFAYLASFDTMTGGFTGIQISSASKPTFTLQLNTLTDVPPLLTTVTTTVFNHINNNGLGLTFGQDAGTSQNLGNSFGSLAFSAVLQLGLRNAASAAGWGGTASNITVTFNNSTLQYTIGYSATLGVIFGTNDARLLGFGSVLSGASSYVSNRTPDYIIAPSYPGVMTPGTRDGRNYEPSGITSQAVSGTGTVFGMWRPACPLYRDWTQQYEPPEKTERIRANPTVHPFTHQGLFEKCRTGIPFVVINGFGNGFNEVFFLRADKASAWMPEFASPGNAAQSHIRYEAVVAGTII